MWTHFWDMHSGGSQKEDFAHCFIEAPEDEACQIFYNRFGHNPHRITCTCCGGDYSITEYETLEGAMKYQIDNKCKDELVVIRDSELTPADRDGELPQQGYVWAG